MYRPRVFDLRTRKTTVSRSSKPTLCRPCLSLTLHLLVLEGLQHLSGRLERFVVNYDHRTARQVLRLVEELKHKPRLFALHRDAACEAADAALAFLNRLLDLALLLSGGENASSLPHMLRHDNRLVARI